jgi:enoyl-CoA hydratase/carnithine racemase
VSAVLTEVRGPLAVIWINRPDKLNALTPDILEALTAELEKLGSDTDVCALSIEGCGSKAFAAGCDVALFDAFDDSQLVQFMEKGRQAVGAVRCCPKPVIAAVKGFALGGGFELALACDLIVAEKGASFGFPEVKLGLIPGFGGTYLLPRLVGPHRARDIIYRGSIIDANTAREWGIVNRVVESGVLADEVVRLCDEIRARDPMSISAAKRSINAAMDSGCEEALSIEKREFLRCFSNSQTKQRISDFLNNTNNR